MALRATVYKVELQVNDLDRQVFENVTVSLACHPSETEERLMVRLVAYALNLAEGLAFGRGISSDDEATIWRHDLTGVLRSWIEVGLPDERVLRRAAGRADEVVLYTYGGRSVAIWWAQNRGALDQLDNLAVFDMPLDFTRALAAAAGRNMKVQVTVQEGELWIAVDEVSLHARFDVLKSKTERS